VAGRVRIERSPPADPLPRALRLRRRLDDNTVERIGDIVAEAITA
jgi:hypothetical protein